MSLEPIAVQERVAQWLRMSRLIRQMSQAGLAERLNISTETLARYERGEREMSLTLLPLCAQVLNIPPSTILPTLFGPHLEASSEELVDRGTAALVDIARINPAALGMIVAMLSSATYGAQVLAKEQRPPAP